jgi:hypothetical protein
MSDKPWHRAQSVVGGEHHKAGARPPTEDEQQDAEFLAAKISALLERLSNLGFKDNEGLFFIAEIAFIHQDEELPNWSTKAGAIRAVRNILHGHAVLAWGHERINHARMLIEQDLL